MTIDNLISWLQEAEDNNTWLVSTQSVKRHLEEIKKMNVIRNLKSNEKQCDIHVVVGQREQLVCPECKGTDCKTAIHTDYKECNKCYHYWEAS